MAKPEITDDFDMVCDIGFISCDSTVQYARCSKPGISGDFDLMCDVGFHLPRFYYSIFTPVANLKSLVNFTLFNNSILLQNHVTNRSVED